MVTREKNLYQIFSGIQYPRYELLWDLFDALF